MINSLSRFLNANIGQTCEKTNKNAKKNANLVKKSAYWPIFVLKMGYFS